MKYAEKIIRTKFHTHYAEFNINHNIIDDYEMEFRGRLELTLTLWIKFNPEINLRIKF